MKNTFTLHVRYCADKDRHSWVAFRYVMNYEGAAQFEKLSKEIINDKKKLQMTPGYIIKPSLKSQWNEAVAEADKLMAQTLEKRIELFKPKKKKKTSENSDSSDGKSKENGRKRKLSSSNEEIISKKSKSDVSINSCDGKNFNH